MYDTGKVLAGLLVFAVFMTSPFWLNAGKTGAPQKLEMPAVEKGKECVEPKEFMRANHMQMLDDWRHEVVRLTERSYKNSKGKEFGKSLTNTCLDCHAKKKDFCDRCHTYAGVNPFCMECHAAPEAKI